MEDTAGAGASRQQTKVRRQEPTGTGDDFFGQIPLVANPSASDMVMSYSVKKANKLYEKDKKKGQIYEFVDYEDPECSVVAFKKISITKPEVRLNCFVTSFPFSGHSTQDEVGNTIMPPIQSTL